MSHPEQCFQEAFEYLLKNKPRKNLTQKLKSDRIGLSQAQISKVATGTSATTEEKRRKIAALYGYDGSAPGRMYDDFLKIGSKIIHAKENDSLGTIFVDIDEFNDYERGENNEVNLQETILKIIALQHKNLIDNFDNKQLAYEINRMLIEIEKRDPDAFKRLEKIVSLFYEEIMKKDPGSSNE
jgi:transcriptional regulator with XRE-family HTH domain